MPSITKSWGIRSFDQGFNLFNTVFVLFGRGGWERVLRTALFISATIKYSCILEVCWGWRIRFETSQARFTRDKAETVLKEGDASAGKWIIFVKIILLQQSCLLI